ncbi:MAG: hypothetical protein WCJ19_01460 [bacterium]
MNFNKKSFTVSFITVVLLFLFLLSTPIINPIFASFIILFVYFFLLYWLLDFDIQPVGFFTVLLLSGYYIHSITMFILTISKMMNGSLLFNIFSVFVVFLLSQIVNRIANITNVSTIKKIPLFQVSQSANYILAIVCVFLSILSLQIQKIQPTFFIFYTMLIVAVVLFSNIYLLENKDNRLKFIYSLISFLITTAFICLLVFININLIIRAGIISLVVFTVLGQYYNLVKKNKSDVINYLQLIFIFVIMVGIIILNPEI